MNNYLFVSKRKNMEEYIKSNFDNCIFIHKIPYHYEIKKIIKMIKNNKYKQIIFEDYIIGLDKIIEELQETDIKIKLVWINSLATLNSDIELNNLLEVIELLKNKKIDNLSFTDDGLYEMYNHIKSVSLIKYTVNKCKQISMETDRFIGIYGDDTDWRSNYFNQLAAVKLLDDYIVNLIGAKRISKKYCKLFNINFKNNTDKITVDSFRNSIIKNIVNSAVEFSNKMDLFIMDSYNCGIPCVVGNNTLFFANTELEKMVVVKSDDDINEISEKLDYCIKNRKTIIKLYNELKKKYDKSSKELIKKFVEE